MQITSGTVGLYRAQVVCEKLIGTKKMTVDLCLEVD